MSLTLSLLMGGQVVVTDPPGTVGPLELPCSLSSHPMRIRCQSPADERPRRAGDISVYVPMEGEWAGALRGRARLSAIWHGRAMAIWKEVAGRGGGRSPRQLRRRADKPAALRGRNTRCR